MNKKHTKQNFVNISKEIRKKSNIAVQIALQWFEGSPFSPVYINSLLVKCSSAQSS